MQHRRFTAIIFLFLILLTTSACTGGAPQVSIPQSAVSSSGSASCDNPIFPIKQGATWMYVSTGGPGGAMVYTDTISEAHTGGFTLTSQFTDVTRTQQWDCLPEGLKALQIGSGMAAGVSIQSMTEQFTATEVNGITLPKEITSGMQWEYSLKIQGTMAMPGGQQTESTGVYYNKMQEMGKETITVPAGTFEATKIQATSSINIAATFQGASVPVTFNGVAILWYAPGVGYVKSVENGDFGGTTFTTTTELQTYTIP